MLTSKSCRKNKAVPFVITGIAVVPLFALMLLGGCAPKQSIYYWGEYEEVIHDMYTSPGKADPATQIEKLTATIQQAQSEGKPVPPGLYAHLGMIYAKDGNSTLAREAFNEEKLHFPESAIFIDGLLVRAKMEPQ
ncbi:MAG: DUF4810 domain-containing protein [Desulfopila sp.]